MRNVNDRKLKVCCRYGFDGIKSKSFCGSAFYTVSLRRKSYTFTHSTPFSSMWRLIRSSVMITLRNESSIFKRLAISCWRFSAVGRLHIHPFRTTIAHKVYFQLTSAVSPIGSLGTSRYHPYVYQIATQSEFVVYQVLYQMRFFHLSEADACIP